MTEKNIIQCPHCNIFVEILALNCGIFRCGMLKKDGSQINPHLDQASCERLVQNGEIDGCSKPFQVSLTGEVTICGYI